MWIKRLLCGFILTALVMGAWSCGSTVPGDPADLGGGDDPILPTAITLSATGPVLLGTPLTLSVAVEPSNASTSCTWSSSDDTTATVSNGIITGVSPGSVTITATSTLATSVSDTISLDVSFLPGNVNFTNAGATGKDGPTQIQVDAEYGVGAVTITDNGVQEWTVPYSTTYTITVAGAKGGDQSPHSGGSGIIVSSNVDLTEGAVLKIVVGQEGAPAPTEQSYRAASGGGGSFVFTGAKSSGVLILAAGGGGGSRGADACEGINNNSDANYGENGDTIENTCLDSYTAAGGTGGSSGDYSSRIDQKHSGGPGMGWGGVDSTCNINTNDQCDIAGNLFVGGTKTTGGANGGFGGGGAAGCISCLTISYAWAGGGGGYSGGGSGFNSGYNDSQRGGGGGSYLTGTNKTNGGLNPSANGFVTISW